MGGRRVGGGGGARGVRVEKFRVGGSGSGSGEKKKCC
jgi:hypothetical protein